jgi:hypothetical protein
VNLLSRCEEAGSLQTRFFAASIRWHFPGRSPFGGDYEGIGQVLDWLGRAFQASDGTIRIDVHDVIAARSTWKKSAD